MRRRIDCCAPDCPRRTAECHSVCPDYLAQRAERDEALEALKARRSVITDRLDMDLKRILRTERYYHRHK